MSDPYLNQASARVVRMFTLYLDNIDPDNRQFQSFITNYVATKEAKDPKTIPYSELYKVIKEGIREYIRQKKGPA